MADLTCPKLRRFDAPLLHRWLKLPPEHAGLVDEAEEPSQLLTQLRDKQLWPEAMRLLAYGLPEREATWWSCMCVRHTGHDMPQTETAVVAAAETWVRQADPHTRAKTGQAIMAAGYGAPGSWCGFAAVWSHRKRFLPDLCGGRGAATAVSRAAERDEADQHRQRLRYRAFLTSGVDIGNGGAGRLPPEQTTDEKAA